MNTINKNLVKYAFIDRDGTIIKETPDERIDSLDKLSFVPGVIEGLKTLKEGNTKLFLATININSAKNCFRTICSIPLMNIF